MIDPSRALISHVVGREVVRRAADTLAPEGIPVLVLKGAWLQSCVYAADDPRVIRDVDLLVPDYAFERALAALERAGWRRSGGNLFETSLSHPDLQLPIDLHRQLFTRGAFALPTDALFARARVDRDAFGVEVHLPDPRDAFAHLLGHFLKNRTPTGDPIRLRDFVAIVERFGPDPAECALHLHAAGLARAARFVLHDLTSGEHGAFHRALLAALPRDRIGVGLVRIARALAARRESGPLGALPGFMLDRTLAAGARALVLRAIDRRRERHARMDVPRS